MDMLAGADKKQVLEYTLDTNLSQNKANKKAKKL